MNDFPANYQELKKNELPWMRMISGDKNPLVRKWLILFFRAIRFLFYPLIAWKSGYLLWGEKVKKLMKDGKHPEAYEFCVDRLSNWEKNEPHPGKKRDWPPFQAAWWSLFSCLCECAHRMDGPDALKSLELVFEKRPDGDSGYSVSNGYCDLTRAAWVKGDKERAWSYVQKAVDCDRTYGYPYYLRAWAGEQLGLGQPLRDMVSAIQNQRELKDRIFKDAFFLTKPALLESLKSQLG